MNRQFKNFLADIENECGDLIFVSEIRWLSRDQALVRFLSLLNEIQIFMTEQNKCVPELINPIWIFDLAFMVDIISHLNTLNTRLQGKDQLINKLYSYILFYRFGASSIKTRKLCPLSKLQ